MRKFFCFGLMLAFVFLISCSSSRNTGAPSLVTNPTVVPPADREFRAAWVATVANINWPSKPGLSTEEQKKEAVALLDFLQQHNFNAVIFQVRPQADALYKSDIEPWSYYLSGKQGQAPNPYYDPLEFWTEEAHNRGIELHVWLNPYRSHHKDGKEITEHSIVKRKPELSVYLKEGYWWMDPSKKETQDHSYSVVMDLVKRYDIDGVHFDDYFYPYPSYNLGKDFPDSASYAAYQSAGGKMSRGDFRRDAVNKFIKRVYEGVKSEKPHVKFGISPFGIWRPGYPASVEGFDQYDQLYADAKLWLNEGWLDYFAPQLYWPINRIAQSYPVLLGWWQSENTKQRHLWPGISVGRDTGAMTVNETINQILISRGMVPQSKGVIHWSISSDVKNTKLAEAMRNGVYRRQAIVPPSNWLDASPPPAMIASATRNAGRIHIGRGNTDKDIFRWVVYTKYGNNWSYRILNRNDMSLELDETITVGKTTAKLQQLAVSSIDRTGNESEIKVLEIK